MAEPIAVIPEHIAALPEEEQGPALVQEIMDRKRGSGQCRSGKPEMHAEVRE